MGTHEEDKRGAEHGESPVAPATIVSPAEAYGEECGGKGGVPYCTFAPVGTRIACVTIWHRQFVDGIQLQTDQSHLPRIGGTGRHKDVREDSFELSPGEFLKGISLEYWSYIERIVFHSNKRPYGPYGGEAGRLKRTLQAPEGWLIAGFKGRHWDFVDSMHLMIAPLS